MHYSVEMLVRGRAEVVEYYRVAAERWGEIWHRPDAHDLARLSKMLSSEQMWFERNCGGRWVGQEVMVVSGLAGLYSTEVGFDDRLEQARLLYDAFQTSSTASRSRASRRKSLGPTTSSTKVECDAVMVRGDGQ